jgi:orotate phosphoribosyltransferase
MLPSIGGTVGSDFRVRLRVAIGEPRRRMLLRAGEVWRQHDPGAPPRRAVFETSSGRFHDEFITLWELFDERELFSACVERLAGLARQVRDEKGYTTIVTSTATAKHLVEYVHAKIESADDRIAVRYLGPYPFLGSGNRELINFKGEKVLIVADVIDSGTVVKNLARPSAT